MKFVNCSKILIGNSTGIGLKNVFLTYPLNPKRLTPAICEITRTINANVNVVIGEAVGLFIYVTSPITNWMINPNWLATKINTKSKNASNP